MTARPRVLMHLPFHPVAGNWVRAAEQHAEVVAVRLRRGGWPTVRVGDDGVHEVSVPRPRPGRLFWGVGQRIEARGIVQLLDRLEAEGTPITVLHAHFAASSRGMALAARRRGLPLIVTEHSTWFTGENPDQPPITPDRLRRMLLPYHQASAVMPVSESLRQAMIAAGVGHDLEVCPNPVDVTRFTADPGRAANRLITVSRLAPVKRIDVLVDAVAELRSRGVDVELEIVGDGPSAQGLRQQIIDLRLDDVVTMTGRLESGDVARRLAAAGLFVTCSIVENHPVAVIEAMSSGLSIIGPAIPSLVEMVPQPECGTLLDGELTPVRLADAISAHLPGGTNERSRSRIVEHASIDAVGRRLADTYAAALA
ncbi:MAG: glycosyltransferase family 4 protein [Actinomycetota bacterium]